jgi:hypothetical protein
VADERFLLADVGLSQTGVPGLILATRILKFDSFSMTTGVHLLFDAVLAPLVASSAHLLAGQQKQPSPRKSSVLAGFLLQLGLLDPDDARAVLADFAAAQLPRDDPRRVVYLRLRAERMLGE